MRNWILILISLLVLPGAALAALDGWSDWEDEDFEPHRGGPLAPTQSGDGILFRIAAEDARTVFLAGDFNDWSDGDLPLRRGRRGVWRAKVDLPDGEWHYLFIVDGEWIHDPDNPLVTRATGEESRITVEDGEVVAPERETRRGDFDLNGTYNRVDGAHLQTELGYAADLPRHPEISLGLGYAFSRERWLYDLEVSLPVFDSDLLDIGGASYRRTDTPDLHRFTEIENTFAALLFRQDWHDFHEAEGVALHTRLNAFAQQLEVRWREEEHRSLEKTTDWGLFGGRRRMRANDPVDEGTLRAVRGRWTWDTRNSTDQPTRGLLLNASWEEAGGELGGDFRFSRRHAELRRYQKLSSAQFFDLRLLAGAIDEGRRSGEQGDLCGYDAIPVQERFYLGGLGTMRATQYKSLHGDRMFLANAEMRVAINDDFHVALFADVGDAWTGDSRRAKLHTDAGIGLQDADGTFRVNVARKMDRDQGDDVLVSARIKRAF